jgi:hypothetical protein
VLLLNTPPTIHVQDADYTPTLTSMLSQQATWSMLELRPQLQKLLGGSGVAVGAPQNKGRQTTDKNVGVPSKNLKSGAAGLTAASWMAVVLAGAAALLV